MRLLSLLSALLLFVGSAFAQPDIQAKPSLTPAQEHFSDMRFGVFIHWGIYSMLGQGEWVMQNQDLHWQEYEKLAGAFILCTLMPKNGYQQLKMRVRAISALLRAITTVSVGYRSIGLQYRGCHPFGRDVLEELAQECKSGHSAPFLLFYFGLAQGGLSARAYRAGMW